MRTAFRRGDIVDKTVGALGITVVVLQRDLNINAVLFSLTVNEVVIDRRFSLIQVGDEFLDSSLIVEGMFL